MAKLETVYIHHVELDAEASVPEHTVAGWAAQGWEPGPLERCQAERDAAEAERLEAARENAERTAAAAALLEAQNSGDLVAAAELTAEITGEPIVALDKLARLPEPPPKGGPGSDLEHWVRYARKAGIDLAPDLNRGEVIDVVEAAIARSEALAAAVETAPTGQTTPTQAAEVDANG